MKIYNGYERLPRNYTLLTDEYEYSMANGYLANGKENQEVVFDVFFRRVPNGGGYAIMAGLDKIIPFRHTILGMWGEIPKNVLRIIEMYTNEQNRSCILLYNYSVNMY